MQNSVEAVVLTGRFRHSNMKPFMSEPVMILVVEVVTTYCRDANERDDHTNYDLTRWKTASESDVWKLQEMGAFNNEKDNT